MEDYLDGRLISICFLLMGYAFESLLKAMLMMEHRECFKPDSKTTDIRTHDLVELCGRCNIPPKCLRS